MDTFYSLNESQRSLWLEVAPNFIRTASLDQSSRGKERFKYLLEVPEVALNLISFVENGILTGDEPYNQESNAFWDPREYSINSRFTYNPQEDIDGNLNRGTLDIDLSIIDPCLRDTRSSQLSLDLPSGSKNEGIVRASPEFENVMPTKTHGNQLDAPYEKNHHNSGEYENADPGIGSIPVKDLATIDHQTQSQLHLANRGSPYRSSLNGRNTSPNRCSTTVSQETIAIPPRNTNGRIPCSFPRCSNKEGLKTAQTYRIHMRKHQEDARQAALAATPNTPPNQSPPKAHPGSRPIDPGSKQQYVAPQAFRDAEGCYVCKDKSCVYIPFKSYNSYKRHCDSVHSGKSSECPYCAEGEAIGTPRKQRHFYTRADAFQKHLKRIHPGIEKNHPVTLEVIKSLRRGSGKGTTWDKTNEPAGKGFEGRDENGVLAFDPDKPKRRHRDANNNPRPSKRRRHEKDGNVLSSYVEDEIPTPRTKVSLQEGGQPSSAAIALTTSRKRAADFGEDMNSDVTVLKKTKLGHESPPSCSSSVFWGPHENAIGEPYDGEAENHQVGIVGGSINLDKNPSQDDGLGQSSNVADVANLAGQDVPDEQATSSPFVLPFDPSYSSRAYQDEIDDVLDTYRQPTPETTDTPDYGLSNHIYSTPLAYEDSERRLVGLVDESQVIFDYIDLTGHTGTQSG